jgi:ethanolamine ammonia-lyase small subunit
MKTEPPPSLPALVTPTPWNALKNFTDARIALGRAGVSLPTSAHLAFQLAHAQARDAVHLPFDAHGVSASLQALGQPTLRLHSQATNRTLYLQRPDLGRRLDAASLQALAEWQAQQGDAPGFDVAFVLVDGLSSLAIHQNAVALVALMLQRLQADTALPWTVAPLSVVVQGRVAIGDEVGAALRAGTVVVLIGERPGLSSPDSMGIYLTWAPKVGTTDAARNCISNIRPAGLSIDAAAGTLHQLLVRARRQQLTGVGLKDDTDHALSEPQKTPPHPPLISFWQSQSRDSR